MIDRMSDTIIWKSVYASRSSEAVERWQQHEDSVISERIREVEAMLTVSTKKGEPINPDERLLMRKLKELQEDG